MNTDPQTACPNCHHDQHLPGTDCDAVMGHGPNRWHRCLCLARPGAALSCPPQMTCQGGTLGYSDIWYLQHGHTLMTADGEISPEAVMQTGVMSVGFPSGAPEPAPAAPVAAPPTGQAVAEPVNPCTRGVTFCGQHGYDCPPLAGQAGLRDRIAKAVDEGFRLHAELGDASLGDSITDSVLTAVLSALPAASEPHRLALSEALSLGTGAPWDAIRERAAELQAEVASLTEASRRLLEQRQEMAEERYAWQERGDRAEERVRALEAGQAALSDTDRKFLAFALDLAADQMASRGDEFGPDDEDAMKRLRRLAAETPGPETQGDEVALLRLTLDAVEEGRRELRAENARLRAQLWTLAAALDGLHTLIATSSRDWQTYRVDAWIWAVLCGWDCEQAEHDETCTHGALEETAAMHGWDADTVAKARRYRAAVHVLTAPAVVAEPGKEG